MNNTFISCKESRIESNRSFYGCFYLGPFEEGQSLTVANALRRTLLSECSGLAIISVLIENVNHEYSTLVGVRDSVLDIVLNLKEIVLKKQKNPCDIYNKKGVSAMYDKVGTSFFKPVIGYLKIKGPGVVRAKDLRLPPFIQCVDPNQYIATLTENGFLNMKFVIMEGKGYMIPKSHSVLDYNIVKKRRFLFNQLQQIINQSTEVKNPASKGGSLTLPSTTEVGLHRGATPKGAAFGVKRPSVGVVPPHTGVKRPATAGDVEWEGRKKSGLFLNATPLNVDAVFSPVTKVNYIIEVNDNKILDNSKTKYDFLNHISNLLESRTFLQKNCPFLITCPPLDLATSFDPLQNPALPEVHNVDTLWTPYPVQAWAGKPTHQVGGKVGPEEPAVMSSFFNQSQIMKDIISYIDTFTTSELISYYSSLHPLSLIKEKSLHTIILEIWTNGSVHPREALSFAFSNLASLFLNFEKSQQWGSVYKESSSYEKSLNRINALAFQKELIGPRGGVASPYRKGDFGEPLPEKEKNGRTYRPTTNFIVDSDSILHNQMDSSMFTQTRKEVSSSYQQDPAYKPRLQSGFPVQAWTGKPTGVERPATAGAAGGPIKDLDIAFLNLNLRAYTILKRANIQTIKQLANIPEKELSSILKLDAKSIYSITKRINQFRSLEVKSPHSA